MLSRLGFRKLATVEEVKGGYYISIKTDVCKYGNYYPTTIYAQSKALDAFIKFYYPLYLSDLKDHKEAEGLPY